MAKASLLFDALIRRLKPTAILVCQLKFCILFYCSFSLLAKAVLIVNFLDPLVKTDGNKYSPLQLSISVFFFSILPLTSASKINFCFFLFIAVGFSQRIMKCTMIPGFSHIDVHKEEFPEFLKYSNYN